MDLDAVLARTPQLALVDENAHTNSPGSRHPKRWQDIAELLNAGIDVYTTLNIQHLESFRDIVAQTTGVLVRETIPDRVLDEASEIEVVDLPPEELLQRLREGKVYVPEQAARAMQGFFESGNLIALREITLRRAANRVDEQMRQYLQAYSTPGILPVTERLLVCISGSPHSEHLIRTARRLAEELKTDWHVLYVETADRGKLTRENQERIWRELRLAESLGAKEVSTLTEDSAADAVTEYARKHHITKIIVGRPTRPRWREWRRGSFVDQILRQSKEIDVYVVSDPGRIQKGKKIARQASRSPWSSYLASLLLVAGATAAGGMVSSFLSPINLVMIFLLAVVVASLLLGFRPALVTALLGVLVFDFFFLPPFYSFAVADTQYLITFAGLLTVGAVISALVARSKSQTESIRVRETQTATLYALTRDLASAVSLNDILSAVIRHVRETLDAQLAILLPEGESLTVQASSRGFSLGEKEKSVAIWAFRNGQEAGRGTETLSSAALLHIPLQTGGRVVGVMGIQFRNSVEGLSPEDRHRLLEAFSSQAALAIERARLAQKAEETQVLQATERLERSLLNSISHDFRTPLSSITGALSSLREGGHGADLESRRELIDLAWEEAERINRFVSNLLDMTRLEAGALKIRKEPYDVQELLGSCLASFEPRLGGKKVQTDIPPNLPLISMDSVLMAQVLINLLDNALKYSPPAGKIEVTVRTREDWLEIEVADQGPGIPEEYLAQVFNKFFRLSRREEVSGTGLGLAISKGIVEAHGGRIRAENRPGGGSQIIFTLPLTNSEGKNKPETADKNT
jgi:two-component system sensor histidine kinase KdpD